MPKIAIDEDHIRSYRSSAKASGKSVFLWDEIEPGFGCSITKKGKVSFLYQYWIGGEVGKATRLVIGDNKALTVAKARNKVANLKDKRKRGDEVVSVVKARVQKEKKELATKSFAYHVDEYLKLNPKNGKYGIEVRRIFDKDILGTLGNLLITKITKDHIETIIGKKKKIAPGLSRVMYTMLKPFFNWALNKGYITKSPMIGIDRPKLTVEARDRFLKEHEIPAFWDSCQDLGMFGCIYKLLLLTSARREEVGGMTWKELDLDKRIWTIPGSRTKNKREHVIHINDQALAILESIKPIDGCEFVFTSTGKKSAKGYSHAKLELDRRMKVALGNKFEDWHTHDIRHTAATKMAMLKFSPHIVDRVLNHVSGTKKMVKTYQHYEYMDDRKAAIYALGNYVQSLVDPQVSNVVEFKKA
jgi:integrase